MTKLIEAVRVPMTAQVFALVIPLLKAEGYTIRGGLMRYVPGFATKLAFTKGSPLFGTLAANESFKWLNGPERTLFTAMYNGAAAPKRTTKTEAAKAPGKSGKRPAKGSPEAKAWGARMAAARAAKSGKAQPVKAQPQASGSMSNADVAATLADVAATLATLATKLAS